MIAKDKTCCFTGHRMLPNNQNILKSALKDVLTTLIKEGVCYFGCGGARGFDTLAALTVLDFKKQYPNIKLILVLPCRNQTKNWNRRDIELYNTVLASADKITYEADDYYEGCMLDRNRHLIDYSNHCVAYYDGRERGGTAYTVKYASKNGLNIYNIY